MTEPLSVNPSNKPAVAVKPTNVELPKEQRDFKAAQGYGAPVESEADKLSKPQTFEEKVKALGLEKLKKTDAWAVINKDALTTVGKATPDVQTALKKDFLTVLGNKNADASLLKFELHGDSAISPEGVVKIQDSKGRTLFMQIPKEATKESK